MESLQPPSPSSESDGKKPDRFRARLAHITLEDVREMAREFLWRCPHVYDQMAAVVRAVASGKAFGQVCHWIDTETGLRTIIGAFIYKVVPGTRGRRAKVLYYWWEETGSFGPVGPALLKRALMHSNITQWSYLVNETWTSHCKVLAAAGWRAAKVQQGCFGDRDGILFKYVEVPTNEPEQDQLPDPDVRDGGDEGQRSVEV